jgi:Exo70 exocyst complex subunit
MDALLAQQGEWRISASVLREHLAAQLLERILPMYSQFYNTYSAVKFSKRHASDYLRFPPQDVDKILKGFFGRS